jgi:sarcosine oxidase
MRGVSQRYDVIVVGLGGMGSAAAFQLARRGRRVLGLEQFTPAHDRGSSHGRSRVIRQAYFEDPAYVPLLLRAYELWEQIERESGLSVLTVTGGLMLGREASHTFAGTLKSARQWGLAHEVLNAAEIRRRFPVLEPAPDLVGFYETKAGFVHPEHAVWAHLQQAAAAGAELRFTEPVVAWSADAKGVQVTTGRGRYEAERLVIAPGAWAPALMAGLELPFTVTRQVLYWFDPVGGEAPFAVGRFPIYIWEMEDGVQFYGFPAQPGVPGVKVAFFYEGRKVDPDDVNRVVSTEEIERMRTAIAPRIPALNGPLRATATCLYTEVPDHHFVLALHPAHENVVLASPCSGHGFKFCSVVGEVLADLATTGRTGHEVALFDPARFRAAS